MTNERAIDTEIPRDPDADRDIEVVVLSMLLNSGNHYEVAVIPEFGDNYTETDTEILCEKGDGSEILHINRAQVAILSKVTRSVKKSTLDRPGQIAQELDERDESR